MKQVTIHCPGTVANLVCGFDILGMALKAPYDVMEVKLLDEPKVIIHNRDTFNLPTDPEKRGWCCFPGGDGKGGRQYWF